MGREEKPCESQKASHFCELATQVFADPFSLTIPDRTVAGEERFWTIGRIENLLVVVVVHTNREQPDEEVIRIISARRATARERRFYEEAD